MLLRRVYGQELMFTMVVTFSVFLIGIGIIQFIWGLAPKPVASPTEMLVDIFEVSMPLYRLIIIGIAALVYILIQLLLNRTIIGRALRAGIEDPDKVQGLGINIYKIITFTFVVASGLAGLGGVLNGPLIMVGPYMGFDMLLYAFVTVILGGLGSIKGTLVSAIILGQVISIGGTLWAPLSYLAPFVVMFFVILIKPTGLFGVAGKAFGFEE
jgi:branched-chain amino acid transport system permease protein